MNLKKTISEAAIRAALPRGLDPLVTIEITDKKVTLFQIGDVRLAYRDYAIEVTIPAPPETAEFTVVTATIDGFGTTRKAFGKYDTTAKGEFIRTAEDKGATITEEKQQLPVDDDGKPPVDMDVPF